MADIEQMNRQVDNLKMKRNKNQDEINKHQEEIDKLRDEQEKIQDQIDRITGVKEESDAAITTTNAGDISQFGGRGNYAPKIGMVLKRKKRKNESNVIKYMDNLLG